MTPCTAVYSNLLFVFLFNLVKLKQYNPEPFRMGKCKLHKCVLLTKVDAKQVSAKIYSMHTLRMS